VNSVRAGNSGIREFRAGIPGEVYSILLPVAEQVARVAIPLVGLGPWFLPLQGPGEESFQGFDEGVRTEWPAGTGVTAQQLIELLVVGLADECLPTADQLQQRSHGEVGIVPFGKVGRTARPRSILWTGAETCTHRVAFCVPCRCKQVPLIHDEGVEALLPKMSFPTLAQIDHTNIPARRFPQRVP